MNSSRPYLLRAIHEWLVDNGLTPQIVVATDVEGVRVPANYVADNRIVLNVSHQAVRGLALGNDRVEFDARFGGRPFHVVVPIPAVLAVVARENGVGMSFPEQEFTDEPPPAPSPGKAGRPSLKVVK